VWTIDLKKDGKVYKGEAKPKADVTLIMSDDVLVQIAEGKVRLLRLNEKGGRLLARLPR
jgi:putative sterol carrier protein